jgi:Actin
MCFPQLVGVCVFRRQESQPGEHNRLSDLAQVDFAHCLCGSVALGHYAHRCLYVSSCVTLRLAGCLSVSVFVCRGSLGTPKHVRVMTSVSGDVTAAQSRSAGVGSNATHHRAHGSGTDGERNRKKEWYVGRHAEERRGLLQLSYPMEHGIVTDWTAMEKVWSEVYRSLGTEASEHPVLLTEAPLNPRQNREHAAEIFFEQFGVPAFFVSVQAVLSLYVVCHQLRVCMCVHVWMF